MLALNTWNGVIIISHNEHFIMSIAREVSCCYCLIFATNMLNTIQLWVCGDGIVLKFKGNVEAYKVCWSPYKPTKCANDSQNITELDSQQYQG
jgi:hypothetical protein